MREILFRGKKIGSGEWVEGYYGLFADFEADLPAIIGIDRPRPIWPINGITLGEFTGFIDKNGKKIFEGDILKLRPGTYYPVVYDMDYGAFGSCYFSDFDFLHKYDFKKVEVVGNIYDNPELLR